MTEIRNRISTMNVGQAQQQVVKDALYNYLPPKRNIHQTPQRDQLSNHPKVIALNKENNAKVRIDMDMVTKEVTMDRVSPRPHGKMNSSLQRSKPPISEKRRMAKSISVK